MGSVVVKYALVIALFVVIVCGAYYSGYSAGSSNTKIEYVTKEKEVIKYVAKEKAIIYSKPNAARDELIGLYERNEL